MTFGAGFSGCWAAAPREATEKAAKTSRVRQFRKKGISTDFSSSGLRTAASAPPTVAMTR